MRTRLGRARGMAVAAALVLAAAACGDGGRVADAPGAAWEVAYEGEKGGLALFGIAPVSADEGWAVGAERSEPGSNGGRYVLLHGEGGEWRPRPLPLGDGERFDAPPRLAASGPDEVWLWGRLRGATVRDSTVPYAARWDGGRWHRVPARFAVADLAVLGPGDVWALSGPDERLARHWDGARWQTVRLPARAAALDARAPGDMWAAGFRRVAGEDPSGTEVQPAALHWDGRRWSSTPTPEYRFPAPRPPEETASLEKIVALAADAALAFGRHTFNHGETTEKEPEAEEILLRWDGSAWQKVPGEVAGVLPDLVGVTAPVAADGGGGVVVGPGRHWTDAASGGRTVRQIGWSDDRRLELSALVRAPGSRTVWGAGKLRPAPDGGTDDGPQDGRAVIVRYDTAGPAGAEETAAAGGTGDAAK